MIVQEPVQAAIWHCLNHYAYEDAIFLAERLFAEVDSDDTIFLLATCYYRSGKPGRAYAVLQSRESKSPQCKYLMARCCLDLQKLSEAEAVLTSGSGAVSASAARIPLDDIIADFGDERAAFALQLLACICSRTERIPRASEALQRSLRLNPFLWHSFEELCDLGEKPDPKKVFQLSSLENFHSCLGFNPIINYFNSQKAPDLVIGGMNNYAANNDCGANPGFSLSNTPSSMVNCFNSTPNGWMNDESAPTGLPHIPSQPGVPPVRNTRLQKFPCTRILFKSLTAYDSPSFGVIPLELTKSFESFDHSPTPSLGPQTPSPIGVPPLQQLPETNDQKGLAPKRQLISRKDTPLQQGKQVFSPSGNTSNSANIVTSTPSPGNLPGGLQSGPNVRRSSRLFSNSYSVKENNKSPNRNKFVTPKSPSRKTKTRLTKTSLSKNSFSDLNEKNRSEGGGVVNVGKGEKEKTETIASEGRILGSGGNIGSGGVTNVHVGPHQNWKSYSERSLYFQKLSAEGLMALFQELGTAYLHLSQFNCKKAIECLENLPQHQHDTGWVLSLIAKAYYYLNDYRSAIKYFAEVREREPHRTQLMELYSSSLWHTQKEVALSALAQDLVRLDRHCAATWCATGNCFSLQKEHETAIKFFHRAVQVDPNFAYAFTLLGHEYYTTEEMEKAMSCFRSALRVDSRHYNAWYGIGTVYFKQERYQLAEMHFKRALAINPQSALLLCHIGVVQHAMQNTEKALQTLNAAIALDPKNPLSKFHRASIYFNIDRHADALRELEELKEIVPKESQVYFLIGKVHNKLGNTHLALMHFSWAMDLDPKGANSQIKEAIDPAVSRSQAEEASQSMVSTISTIPFTTGAEANEGNPTTPSTSAAFERLSSEVIPHFPTLPSSESDESL
ncbi:cell division cycle protein 27 homolog isoform X2 [Ischnura elegans]|uniref:cell division cycle protein 27 homolog isoform X2 n=1 Tax=Ischnura elegans TaxID=197161 RepID=UPI001ED86AC2|nr:cell division cycle protein 27 homolog isoform X2 [Ischnura elegans]